MRVTTGGIRVGRRSGLVMMISTSSSFTMPTSSGRRVAPGRRRRCRHRGGTPAPAASLLDAAEHRGDRHAHGFGERGDGVGYLASQARASARGRDRSDVRDGGHADFFNPRRVGWRRPVSCPSRSCHDRGRRRRRGGIGQCRGLDREGSVLPWAASALTSASGALEGNKGGGHFSTAPFRHGRSICAPTGTPVCCCIVSADRRWRRRPVGRIRSPL